MMFLCPISQPAFQPHFGAKRREPKKPIWLKPVGRMEPVTVDGIITRSGIKPGYRQVIESIVRAHQRVYRAIRPKVTPKSSIRPGLSPENRALTMGLQTMSRLEAFLSRTDLATLVHALPSGKLRYLGSGGDAIVFHAPRQKHVVKIRKVRPHIKKDYLLPGAEDLVWQPKPIISIPAKGTHDEDIEYVVERQLLTRSTGITDADRDALNKKTESRGFVVYDDHPANYGRRGNGKKKQIRFIDVECVLKDD